ncbi:hypothetical protein D3C87_407190 [compost metagenome]
MKSFRIVVSMVCCMTACSDPNWNCKHNLTLYQEEWNFLVKKVNTVGEYQIETTSGRVLSFKPFQNIIAWTNPGDRLVKIKNTNWCYIINHEGDTLTSRIFNESCDKFIDSVRWERSE